MTHTPEALGTGMLPPICTDGQLPFISLFAAFLFAIRAPTPISLTEKKTALISRPAWASVTVNR